jgi:hypothetical protein
MVQDCPDVRATPDDGDQLYLRRTKSKAAVGDRPKAFTAEDAESAEKAQRR